MNDTDIVKRIYDIYLKSRKVITDSRAITPGCVFIAFKGANFDGNSFVPQALEQGAACCVTSDQRYAGDSRCFVVDDVLATTQQLASLHRENMRIPVIGITGTNGKTTTKELVHAVLSKKYKTHATAGNFNNHLGVPLTLLSTPEDTDIAIIEMGANHPGEIDALCAIARPDFGLITNVGKAHLEGFGGFEGVVRTKTELYRFLACHGGSAFVNADNSILMEKALALSMLSETESDIPGVIPSVPDIKGKKAEGCLCTITYGSGNEAEVRGSCLGSEPYMKFYFEVDDSVYNVQSHLLGNYNFDNAMAAVCIGRFFNVEPFDIKEAIEGYIPSNNRSQYKKTAHNELILDCYNANPSSMKAALDNFAKLQHPCKWVVLGGMKELGADSVKEHEAVAEQLTRCGLSGAILIGNEFASVNAMPTTVDGMKPLWFAGNGEAKAYFASHPLTGAMVLLKGSNSTRIWEMEEVL